MVLKETKIILDEGSCFVGIIENEKGLCLAWRAEALKDMEDIDDQYFLRKDLKKLSLHLKRIIGKEDASLPRTVNGKLVDVYREENENIVVIVSKTGKIRLGFEEAEELVKQIEEKSKSEEEKGG